VRMPVDVCLVYECVLSIGVPERPVQKAKNPKYYTNVYSTEVILYGCAEWRSTVNMECEM
jgi:hypothetical protein